MIQLRVIFEPHSQSEIEYFPETVYTCKECGVLLPFYSIPPKQCRSCNAKVPNLRGLKYNPEAKKNYYLTGNF